MLSVAMAFGQTLNDTIAEVTVSGYHVPANISAATPMHVLSSEQLLRLGATDVGDALKHFAGVQVKDFGGVGGMKTVSIRSLGAQHTGVSYDGVSVGDCQSGQVDLSRFALSNLSSITLTVGQGDNLFVPARQLASAATINISSQPSDTLLYIYMSAGSYGLANPSLHFGRRLKGLRLSAYGEYKYAKGDYPFRLWNGRHLIDEHRNNSDISLWRGEINLLAEPGRHQKIAAKVYGYSSVRGLPGAVIYDNPIANERLTDKNAFVQLLYENIFSRKLRLRSAAKWNYSWMKDRNADAASTRTDIFRQRETYLTATLLWQPVGCLQAALAQDFTHNYLSTTLVTCPFPSRSTWQTALSARYATGRIAINASLLATAVVETVEKGTAADNRSRLSPALSITWKPFGSNLHLRLSYKDIFRLPTLNDLYYTVIGNVNLRPEKSRQWNVGATWSCQHSGGRGFVAATVDAYHASVSDKIVAMPTMFVWRMMNVGKVRTFGIDATLTAEHRWSRAEVLTMMLSYNFADATDRTDPHDVQYGHQIAYTPKHSGAANVTFASRYATLSYNLLFSGRRYSLGYNIPDNLMHSFFDHSVSLSKEFALGRGKMRVSAELLNIGNRNYEVVRFYPMQGRNYRVTITYNF